jgi:transposase-like protein
MKQNTTRSQQTTDGDSKPAQPGQPGHFTPDDVFKAINPGFFDEDMIRYWVVHRLHHAGARCPSCGEKVQPAQRQRWVALKSIICRYCGAQFKATTGTFLEGSQVTLRAVFFMFLMFRLGLTNRQIADRMQYSTETVRQWRQRADALEKIEAAEL